MDGKEWISAEKDELTADENGSTTKNMSMKRLSTGNETDERLLADKDDLKGVKMSREGKRLAEVVKRTHKRLRRRYRQESDDTKVWSEHVTQQEELQQYSKAMITLATQHWQDHSQSSSRVHWLHSAISQYYQEGGKQRAIEKELRKLSHLNLTPDYSVCEEREEPSRVKVLDVGSCYNPFSVYEELDVTAIDLWPASELVQKADFLELQVSVPPATGNTENGPVSIPDPTKSSQTTDNADINISKIKYEILESNSAVFEISDCVKPEKIQEENVNNSLNKSLVCETGRVSDSPQNETAEFVTITTKNNEREKTFDISERAQLETSDSFNTTTETKEQAKLSGSEQMETDQSFRISIETKDHKTTESTKATTETKEHDKTVDGNKMKSLPSSYFDVVIFCLLLEYLPSPKHRFQCCQKAYRLLKPNGILCIATPDSKHQNANVILYKLWKISLGFAGFSRVKYEKSTHFHGMVFRKGLCREAWNLDSERELEAAKKTKVRGKFASITYEKVRTEMYIPQDFHDPSDSEQEIKD